MGEFLPERLGQPEHYYQLKAKNRKKTQAVEDIASTRVQAHRNYWGQGYDTNSGSLLWQNSDKPGMK